MFYPLTMCALQIVFMIMIVFYVNYDFVIITNELMKKRSERCKHCVLAVVRPSQKFSPHSRPPSRGVRWPKFNQLEMVITFTYKPSLVRIDAHNSSYRGNRPTKNKHSHKPTHRQDRLQYTVPLSLACSVITVVKCFDIGGWVAGRASGLCKRSNVVKTLVC